MSRSEIKASQVYERLTAERAASHARQIRDAAATLTRRVA